MDYYKLAISIEYQIKMKKLSKKEVASMCGISYESFRNTLYNLKSGKNINMVFLKKISEALEVSVSIFFENV